MWVCGISVYGAVAVSLIFARRPPVCESDCFGAKGAVANPAHPYTRVRRLEEQINIGLWVYATASAESRVPCVYEFLVGYYSSTLFEVKMEMESWRVTEYRKLPL